jgi:hypothetical protein
MRSFYKTEFWIFPGDFSSCAPPGIFSFLNETAAFAAPEKDLRQHLFAITTTVRI